MKDVLLSICVPLHNRTITLIKQIEELLKCKDSRFNIVVSDTSEDGYDLNSQWRGNDTKVKIYRFPVDTPPEYNWKNALMCANGLFAMHLNDRDIILPESLPGFLDFLECHRNVNGGVCKYIPNSGQSFVYSNKNDALMSIPYFASHVTGLVFNTDELKNIPDLDFIFSRKNGLHPHDIILGRISQKGNLFIYTKEVWRYATPEFYTKNISGVSNHKTGFFFEPKDRRYELKKTIDDFLKLDFAEQIKKKKLVQMYKTYLGLATNAYFYVLESEYETAHYGIERQKIGILKKYRMSMDILDSFAEEFHFSNEEKKEYKRWLIKTIMIPVIAKYTSRINNPTFRNALRRLRVKKELDNSTLLR